MSLNPPYPRILVISLRRLNAADNSGGGMLLRSLLALQPRTSLAQIYSSGDNGDPGYCDRSYPLGPRDRRFGKLFHRFKGSPQISPSVSAMVGQPSGTMSLLRRLVLNTGLYELIFRPRLHPDLVKWVEAFRPDWILCEGYSLTMVRLPIMLARRLRVPLATFWSDDWPTDLYAGLHGEPTFLRWLIRPVVKLDIGRLLREAHATFAFGPGMAEIYQRRYGRSFPTLHHGDDPTRFEATHPIRVHSDEYFTLLLAGVFDDHRWPHLRTVDAACALLQARGVPVRACVLVTSMPEEARKALANCRHLDFLPDPGNDRLPAYLKGADVLVLLERFDEVQARLITLCISSKAHLFMFSGRPIVVFSHALTGISKYAKADGWAAVVDQDDPDTLAHAVAQILTVPEHAEALVEAAERCARTNHTHESNHGVFYDALQDANRDGRASGMA